MLTLEALRAYGADVDTGLSRCMGMKDFYLRLVNTELGDKNFDLLKSAVEEGNPKAAFEAAHALKGALNNLSLTPLSHPVAELTDLLRQKDAMPDTGELLPRILQALSDLKALAK